jgi:hypothetical protein
MIVFSENVKKIKWKFASFIENMKNNDNTQQYSWFVEFERVKTVIMIHYKDTCFKIQNHNSTRLSCCHWFSCVEKKAIKICLYSSVLREWEFRKSRLFFCRWLWSREKRETKRKWKECTLIKCDLLFDSISLINHVYSLKNE